MSDVSEFEVLNIFGTLDCSYPARNILGKQKVLQCLKV